MPARRLPIPNTTWNPADKSTGITLTGGNLIATNSNNGILGVRAIDGETTGKFYWEVTCNAFTFSSDFVGAVQLAVPVGTYPNGAASGITGVHQAEGAVYVDGSPIGGTNIGAITAGTVISVAVDRGATLIWYRKAPAGNWNNSGTANPATGAGGVTITGFGAGVAIYPAAWLANLNDQVTANFGDSAFSGAVPAGFNAGFGPPAISTAQARAIVLA